MNSRVLSLVHTWLVIDFFGDSRKTGDAGSSLTTTIFTQSFIGLLFAAVFLPEESGLAVGYLAANLCLSTGLVGIGLLGEPKRQKRELADELLVQTAPMPAGSLTMARVLHGSFHLVLVTTGMAIPPAVLSYWACGHDLLAVPLYLLMATACAGIMAGGLSVFTRFVHLTLGPARAQLLTGSLKLLLIGGGLIGFAVSLPHVDDTAAALPFGRTGAMLCPPYWAARIIDAPAGSATFWSMLLATLAALLVLGTLLNRMRRNRVQPRPAGDGLLGRIDRAFAESGALFGVTRFVSTMLYRSPGFRARVLPLFGIPIAMVLLSLWNVQEVKGRALLLGMTLQFPAIYLPFLVAFLPRSDHERAGWVFATAPRTDLELFRAASLVSLTTHVLLPLQLAACVALLLASSFTLAGVCFALAIPAFSLGLGVLVAELCVGRVTHPPFTQDEESEDGDMEFGGLTVIATVLALLGGGFSTVAHTPIGLVLALALAGTALFRVRRRCRKTLSHP